MHPRAAIRGRAHRNHINLFISSPARQRGPKMGNAVSHTVAFCEEEQKQKPEEQPEQKKDEDVPEESGPPPDKDEGTGSPAGEKPEQKSPPKSPERKNVGDDHEAAAKETEAAKKQAAGAQASSKAGQSEVGCCCGVSTLLNHALRHHDYRWESAWCTVAPLLLCPVHQPVTFIA